MTTMNAESFKEYEIPHLFCEHREEILASYKNNPNVPGCRGLNFDPLLECSGIWCNNCILSWSLLGNRTAFGEWAGLNRPNPMPQIIAGMCVEAPCTVSGEVGVFLVVNANDEQVFGYLLKGTVMGIELRPLAPIAYNNILRVYDNPSFLDLRQLLNLGDRLYRVKPCWEAPKKANTEEESEEIEMTEEQVSRALGKKVKIVSKRCGCCHCGE